MPFECRNNGLTRPWTISNLGTQEVGCKDTGSIGSTTSKLIGYRFSNWESGPINDQREGQSITKPNLTLYISREGVSVLLMIGDGGEGEAIL